MPSLFPSIQLPISFAFKNRGSDISEVRWLIKDRRVRWYRVSAGELISTHGVPAG